MKTKIQCKVCNEQPIIMLPDEVEIGMTILCPCCGKQMAHGTDVLTQQGYKEVWELIDNMPDENGITWIVEIKKLKPHQKVVGFESYFDY